MYFDIDMLQIPALFPSDLPSGLGPCRWLVNSALHVRPFAGGPTSLQPRSRLHGQMLRYFGGDAAAAGVPMPGGTRRRKAGGGKNKLEPGEIDDKQDGWTRVQHQRVQPRWRPPRDDQPDGGEMSRRAQEWR